MFVYLIHQRDSCNLHGITQGKTIDWGKKLHPQPYMHIVEQNLHVMNNNRLIFHSKLIKNHIMCLNQSVQSQSNGECLNKITTL